MNTKPILCSACAFSSDEKLVDGHTRFFWCRKFGRWEEVRKTWVCPDYTDDQTYVSWYFRNKKQTSS